MYCNTKQLPELPLSGSNQKPRGARGLSDHFPLRFDPKLDHGTCEISCIPFACVACT